MNPEETQLNTQEEMPIDTMQGANQRLNPNEAAATLAFMTNLSEQGMMAQQMPEEMPMEEPTGEAETMPEEAPEEPKMAPESEETPQDDISAELENFKSETQKMIKEEIGGLKDIIKEVLSDDEEESETEEDTE